MPSATFESPELVALFTTYTASPDSIGAHLAQAAVSATEHDPLLVVTGTDLVLYPGGGKPPLIEPYRLATRGFKELAAISHLGPAVATLARLRELGGDGAADGSRVTAGGPTRPGCSMPPGRPARPTRRPCGATSSRSARSPAGRSAIAAMIDYSCALTERFLQRALADPGYLTMANVRRDYLEGPAADGALPVPFNRVMIATFYLTGMDIAHRLITWLDAVGIDWARAMVIFAGPGRAADGRRDPGVAQHRGRRPRRVQGPAGPRASLHRPARRRLPAARPGRRRHGGGERLGARLPQAVGRPARHLRTRGRHVRRLPALRRPRRRAGASSAPAPTSVGGQAGRDRARTTGSPSSPGCGW